MRCAVSDRSQGSDEILPNTVKLLRDKPADRYADEVRSGNLKAIQQGREIRSEIRHCRRTSPDLGESVSTLVATHHAISSGQRSRNAIPGAKVGPERIKVGPERIDNTNGPQI